MALTRDHLAATPRTSALLLTGVVLSGFCLRPAVTSVGALLPTLREAVPFSATTAGVLTALPTVCFAGLGLLAPRLARRFDPEVVVAGALLLVAVGLGARALAPGPMSFLAASAVALVGVAGANVLGAPLVRRHFPHRAGLVTGLYSAAVAAGVALPAALSVPVAGLAGTDGWRAGLGVWAPVAVLAALPWLLPVARRAHPSTVPDPATGVATSTSPPRSTVVALAVYFGLQSLMGFVVMGWLPAVFGDAGVPAPLAGVLLAATAVLAVPVVLLIPGLVTRRRARPVLVVAIATAGAAGWTGMLLDPAGAPWLWTVLLAAAHCAYPLALVLIRAATADPAAELRLSGVVQTGGYALAAVGPLATGVLRDLADGWTLPIAVVLGALVVQAVAGLGACGPRERYGSLSRRVRAQDFPDS